MALATSVAVSPLRLRVPPRARSRPARAALAAVLLAACAAACAFPLAQLAGGLHVPSYSASGSLAALFLAPATLALFVPLAVAVRRYLAHERTGPWLLIAALGPLVVLAVHGVILLPYHLCIGCCTLN
ncbi:MAG: hypothetical protein A2138_24595 [Deltaproteobacteria bacterium RBG_16_71_12]|nr:MAG: hypothetical protein A2138_24595 [Deltaproteobacteria bacterium RBG_16_71_12]